MKWLVKEIDECKSTFDLSRNLPAWSVVRARRQTGGRGRFNRPWIAEEGGLWASYNLPLPPEIERPWGLLPLVAGLAVLDTLRAFNIIGLRLRWPNDVLVEHAKLAGILVERPKPNLASVGIGMNVYNPVAHLTSQLKDPPARLADLVSVCPSVPQLCILLGNSLKSLFDAFSVSGFDALSPLLQSAWGDAHYVTVFTDTEQFNGYFAGVEPDGSPILQRADGSSFSVPATSVIQLRLIF